MRGNARGLSLVATLHPLAASDPRTLLDFDAVHVVVAVLKVNLCRASPPLVLHVWRSIDAGSM